MAKNYLALARDDNNEAIQVGSGILTADASSTPKDSPLAYSSTALTISVPQNAVKVVFKPSTNLRVSEASDVGTYFVVTAATTHTFEVANTENMYIVRDSEDGTLNFYFVTV